MNVINLTVTRTKERTIIMKPTLFYRIKDKFQNIGDRWDNLSPTQEETIEFAHSHINPEPDRMIDNNHYSMEYCLAHSGESINERYRQNRPDDIDTQISKTVEKNTTDTDIILYRGVCSYVYSLMIKNAKDIPDCDLYEKGFLATSLLKGHELNSEIKLRIYVPSGTKAIYQGNVNYEPNFYEVDVMHGAKLKIISIDKTYINCKLLETA